MAGFDLDDLSTWTVEDVARAMEAMGDRECRELRSMAYASMPARDGRPLRDVPELVEEPTGRLMHECERGRWLGPWLAS